jgi:hypothetical protein
MRRASRVTSEDASLHNDSYYERIHGESEAFCFF